MSILFAAMVVISFDPTQAAAATSTPAVAPGAAEKRICRSVETTGSRFAKKTCHTKSEWVRLDEADKGAASEMMSMRRAASGMDGAPH